MNDPYVGIISIFKKPQNGEADCKLVVGIVKSTAPLTINAAGLENEEDDVLFVGDVPELAANDNVLMLTIDYQKFYIIGRITAYGDDLPLPASS